MALIKDGYWQDAYWAGRYWQEDYWAEYGYVAPPAPPTVTPSVAGMRRKRRRRKPFLLDGETLFLLGEYLRLKVKLFGKRETQN